MPRKTLAQQFEDIALTPLRLACKFSAEGIVRDLQKEGPSWTGTFANSYQIASSSKTTTGSKAAGAPQALKAPRLTADEIKFKPEIKYTITNTAPHKDYALDLKEGRFYPRVPKSSAKKPVIEGGTRPSTEHRRGQVSPGGGTATSTAELDWYNTYTGGGRMDKTVQIAVDQQFKGEL
jgi:hypothetical protein